MMLSLMMSRIITLNIMTLMIMILSLLPHMTLYKVTPGIMILSLKTLS